MTFYERDPVAVHTLAGAASGTLSDLIEHIAPEKSWDKAAQEVTGLTASSYFKIARPTQNFLKHAKDEPDPDLVHEFATSDSEATIFWAVLHLGELLQDRNQKVTLQQSVYL